MNTSQGLTQPPTRNPQCRYHGREKRFPAVEVMKLRSARRAPEVQTELAATMTVKQLRDRLQAGIDNSPDPRYRACYGLLFAIIECNRRQLARQHYLMAVSQLADQIGEDANQLINITHVWLKLPDKLRPNTRADFLELVSKFVDKLRSRRTEQGLMLESRSIERALDNCTNDTQENNLFQSAWNRLQDRV